MLYCPFPHANYFVPILIHPDTILLSSRILILNIYSALHLPTDNEGEMGEKKNTGKNFPVYSNRRFNKTVK